MHKINETFEKSYLLIGLSKFAQTFAVRFLKLSSIHPICINAWGSFSFNSKGGLYFIHLLSSRKEKNTEKDRKKKEDQYFFLFSNIYNPLMNFNQTFSFEFGRWITYNILYMYSAHLLTSLQSIHGKSI